EACSKVVEKGIRDVVVKMQKEFKLDKFGYGAFFHRKYPQEWKKIEKDWDQIFSKAELQVEIEIDIIRTGLINTPIIRRKSR
ncbi:MAG: hypothetical protein GX329_07955, partial [Tissierellia bacterium]|nr:hypothetical protein [Tissierellia bacterium]